MAVRNFQNRTLCHGDNLPFLQGMNTASVDLIATDPPFNKNRDFHATPDKLAGDAKFEDRWCWMNDVQPAWLDEIQKNEPEVEYVVMTAKAVYSSGMAAFLCWLGVRLLEMRRVLAPTGSVYLHIDHTAHAWVKCLMDAIFGRRNFRNEIVWCYKGPGHVQKHFKRKHDIILFYAASAKTVFNGNAVRVPYSPVTLSRRRYAETEGGILAARGGRSSQEVEDEYARGKIPEDWWTGYPSGGQISKAERTGYPTQKPLKLYERIIQASSREGDLVLDPFCGCATTPVAAERLKRQWVGMDLWDGAFEQVQDRLEKQFMGADHQIGRKTAIGLGSFAFDKIHLVTTPFIRNDGGHTTPGFETPFRLQARRERHPHPREQHAKLVDELGAVCQGCGRDYSFDPRVLEVDHREPKADGGSDAYFNLTLLCPPCNRIKRDRMTLGGLQDENRRRGHWQTDTAHSVRHGKQARRRHLC